MKKLKFVNMTQWPKEAVLILRAMNSGYSRMYDYPSNPKVLTLLLPDNRESMKRNPVQTPNDMSLL